AVTGSGRRWRELPAKVCAQVAQRLELSDLVDPPIARTLEVIEPEPDAPVGLVELLRALARIPLRLERGQHPRDLREVRPVVALVGAGPLGEGERAARHRLLHDLGDLPDPV